MKTFAQLQIEREAAGAAYAGAAAAYLSAFAELHAYDLAVSRGKLIGGGFSTLNWPTPHAEFLQQRQDGSVMERANARAAELVKTLEA